MALLAPQHHTAPVDTVTQGQVLGSEVDGTPSPTQHSEARTLDVLLLRRCTELSCRSATRTSNPFSGTSGKWANPSNQILVYVRAAAQLHDVRPW
jgi:hypothetical protein